MKGSTDHERVNDILLGPLERPALQWFSSHMPAWATPDVLTLIGVLGSVVILAGYLLSNSSPGFLWLANVGLLINWFGDSLDGTVARYRKIERPKYGFFVDHTVDAFSQLLVVAGLGMSPFVSLNVALLALIGYLLMSVFVYVRTYVDGIFQISYGRLGPTEVRAVVILFNIFILFTDNPSIKLIGTEIAINDAIIGLLAAVLMVLFVYSTISKARELADVDAR